MLQQIDKKVLGRSMMREDKKVIKIKVTSENVMAANTDY